MKFFVITPGDLKCPVDFYPEEKVASSAPKCTRCNNSAGMLSWEPPYVISTEHYVSTTPEIWYGPGAGNGVIISERAVEVFELAKLMGLGEAAPVRVVNSKFFRGKPLPLPRLFYCKGGRGAALVDQSFVHRKKGSWTCELCGGSDPVFVERISVLEETWNGDDLFFAWGPNVLLCSERLVAVASNAELILGVEFRPSEEYTYDYRPYMGT